MNALPDTDEFDVFDLMEIEKRLSFAVGYAYQRAYLEDDEFTKRLSKLYELLSEMQITFQVFHVGDAVRMFLGSSYRTAKTAIKVFEEAQVWRENYVLFQKLMLVHHDMVDGIVHPLYTAVNFLTRSAVAQTLGIQPSSFRACFKNAFGQRWMDARHALAHEDARMVPKYVASEPKISDIERIQFRGTSGTNIIGLHAKDSDGNSFEFDFGETRYLELLAQLEQVLLKRKR